MCKSKLSNYLPPLYHLLYICPPSLFNPDSFSHTLPSNCARLTGAMENPAATGIKSKFRNHGRPANSRNNSIRSSRNVPRENGNSSGGIVTSDSEPANERTSLLRRAFTNSDGVELWNDDARPLVKWPAYVGRKVQQTLTSNYVNVFLVFVPLGIVSGAVGWSPVATFVLNFLAIIPLASLLSFATEELSARLGQTLGGLLNATFGNAVELIVWMRYL